MTAKRDNMDNERITLIKRLTGLFAGFLAIFLSISAISYLFHWQQDMSLLTDPNMMDNSREVGNAAGKLGFKAGRLMISNLFGLGSLALIWIPVAFCLRLLVDKWHKSLVGTCLKVISATLIFGVTLSYAGDLLELNNLFGDGIGGSCGYFIENWLRDKIGSVPTSLLCIIAIVLWLYFNSRSFSSMLDGIMSGKNKCKKTEFEHQCEREREQEREQESVTEPETYPKAEQIPALECPPDDTPDLTIVDDDTLDEPVKEELQPIDNRLDPPDGLPKYKFPSIDLLGSYLSSKHDVSTEELTINHNKIRATLANFKISIDNVKAVIGPTVTLYKVYPSPGVQIAQIKRLQDDIAMSLNAKGVRVVNLSDSVGIEVANAVSSIVPLKSLMNDAAFRQSNAELPVAIGYTITQKVKVFDLSDAPHLLIAGATKQGKSVGLNVIVNSLLYSKHPSELKFVFIDPKMVEFSAYGELVKHYLAVLPEAESEEDEKARAIVKKVKDAERTLRSLCTEMDDRYELLAKAGANNIKSYNEKYKARKLNPAKGHKYLPYIVVVVDEYADLTMTVGSSPEARAASRSVTNSIIRLAQKGRASGLHVILATQRPSVNVISGIIKSNFPMRIAFKVASRVDSMTIIDAPGAEKLIGKGDMLFSAGIESERIQCGYIATEEIEAITRFIGAQQGFGKCYNTPYYLPSPEESPESTSAAGGGDLGDIDERFEDAARLVVKTQKASTSYLQTRLGMGFAKAARVMSQLEEAGIVGPQDGAKPRPVLVPDEISLESILNDVLK